MLDVSYRALSYEGTLKGRECPAYSCSAQLIEMLRTKGGATLDGICKKFGWQKHTTRALMSAGGSLTKKHGITVISEKVGDSRTYRIAR